MRDMPIRIVSDGVVTRSVRDTAAFYREAERVYRPLSLPPVGDVTRPSSARLRIGLNTSGVGRGADAEITALTEQTASLLEDLGHTVSMAEVPAGERFADDFLLYWSALAFALLRMGAKEHGETWDRTRHDNLTLGLAQHARRNLHRLPATILRLKGQARRVKQVYDEYDVTLTPTLGTPTPKIGHLDPTQDYDTIVDRLLTWVTFTPWQNITGAPAISLPLATTAEGLPQGMMFGAAPGQEALLLGLAYELEQARPWARIQDGTAIS